MKGFNVLLTCCGDHVSERVGSLKNNEDGVDVKVYAVNCAYNNLPFGIVDDAFVVPPISSSYYTQTILDLCKKLNIGVIVPTVTLELDFMARHKEEFERNGIRVSVSSAKSLEIANDKLRLYQRYPSLMPRTVVAKSFSDFERFKQTQSTPKPICCKLTNHCGGNGFGVIDDAKAKDITLFNCAAGPHYLSTRTLKDVLASSRLTVMLQEFISGQDYSVSVLCDKGNVTHICGYVGYEMQHGAITFGEIQKNDSAYHIAEMICKDLELDGNACFDFRLCEDGSVYLLEINPRVNASLPFVKEAGINMLYLRCKQLLGYSIPPQFDMPIRYGLKMKKYHESKYFL